FRIVNRNHRVQSAFGRSVKSKSHLLKTCLKKFRRTCMTFLALLKSFFANESECFIKSVHSIYGSRVVVFMITPELIGTSRIETPVRHKGFAILYEGIGFFGEGDK